MSTELLDIAVALTRANLVDIGLGEEARLSIAHDSAVPPVSTRLGWVSSQDEVLAES